MFKPSPRRLLPIVALYLPVPIVGAALSALWNVGASPEGGAGDMFLKGTALTRRSSCRSSSSSGRLPHATTARPAGPARCSFPW